MNLARAHPPRSWLLAFIAAVGLNLGFVQIVDRLIDKEISRGRVSEPVRVKGFVRTPENAVPERDRMRRELPPPPAAPAPESELRTEPGSRAEPLRAPAGGFDFSDIALPAAGTGPGIPDDVLQAFAGRDSEAATGGAGLEGAVAPAGRAAAPALPELEPTLRVRPTYPLRALQMRVEGHVVAEYTINPDGTVSDIEIIEAKPSGFFERAVIDAVQDWRFQPSDLGDVPVSRRQKSRISFSLRR